MSDMNKINENIADVLGVTHLPTQEIEQTIVSDVVVYNDHEPSQLNDEDEDYILVRSTMRNLIEKGNDALEDIATIAKQNESARGFEVVANLIKTIGETSKDLYALQKTKRDLREPDPDSDPRKKNSDAINVEQAVFVGSAAELLSAIKKQKETNQK